MYNNIDKTKNNVSLLQTFKVGQKRSAHAGNKQEQSIFNAIDANNDGVISKNEMAGVVKGKVKGANGKFVEKEYIKIKDLPNGRSLVVDSQGKKWTMAHDGIILKQEYVENPNKFKAAQTYNNNVKTRKNAETLAQNFYQIADDNSGLHSMVKMQKLLDQNITENNIVAFLDAYDRDNTKKGDTSIIDTVTSEVGAGGTKQQRQVLMTIMNKLCAAAKKRGVSDGDIQKAKKDFEASLNKEFNAAFRRTDPKDMEKAVDFLRGAIVAKENEGAEISDKEAINILKKDAVEKHNSAAKAYRAARNEEGWTAKFGDTVCGWFGCTTIADMDKKLGKNAVAVKSLASAKTETEIKTLYKQVFDIEFDKNKIAARETALGNYQQAQGMASTIKITSGILKNANSSDYNGLRNEIKTKFKFDDKTVDEIINNYGLTSGKNINSDSDKKAMLVKFLQETQNNSAETYRNLTKGKTLEQMRKDLDLLNKSVFGTSDNAKDVANFNQNMVVAEMVTEGAFEVVGTIALQFVPGLGQVAAARLAVSAAKWGSNAVKIANAAQKAEKAFAAVSKFQQGVGFSSKATAKSAQIGSQMAGAGTATAGLGLSNGKDAKTVMRKTLMNMSFAGVGAGSNILAPKLMKAFGITDSALANEIAEEIINSAGSLGISKLSGDEYGSTDAFVDIATGIVMARVSHLKTGKPDAPSSKPDVAAKPEVTTQTPKPEVSTKPSTKTEVKAMSTPEEHKSTAPANEPMAAPRPAVTAPTNKTSIPMNQQIQVNDNIIVLRQTDSWGTIVIDGKPKTLYVKKGQSVTYKDAGGNNIVARHEVDGSFTIETTSSSAPGRINSPAKTWNLTLRDNIPVKISKDKSLTVQGGRCLYHDANSERVSSLKLNPGETVVIDNINGKPITLTRSLDGKYKVSNEAPNQSKINSNNLADKPSASLPKTEDLTAMRRNSPNAYNHLAREELEKLGETKGKRGLYQFIQNARRDVPSSAMSERLLHAIQLENQGRTLVTNLDKNIDLTQISKHVDNGGVFSYNGKLYVNDAGQSVELNLSQEKFEELFPPVQSAFFQQGQLGDCWFVSSLSAQMDVPKGRVELYKRFKQSGDDIIVSSPGKADVVFKGGKCLAAPGIEQGYAKGLRMIEQTTAVHRTSKGTLGVKSGKIDIAEAASIASKPSELMKRLEGGTQSEAFGLLGDFKISSLNEELWREDLTPSQIAEMRNKVIEMANDPNIALGFTTGSRENSTGVYGLLKGTYMENDHAMKIVGLHNGYVEYVNQNYFTSNILKLKFDDFVDKYLASLTWTDFSPGIPTPQGNFNKIIL